MTDDVREAIRLVSGGNVGGPEDWLLRDAMRWLVDDQRKVEDIIRLVHAWLATYAHGSGFDPVEMLAELDEK